MKVKLLWLAALLGMLASLTRPAGAASVLPLSLSDLARQSDLIIEAKVTSSFTAFSAAAEVSMFFTYWEMEVIDRLKGDPPAAVLVRTPGGEHHGRGVVVPGAPRFEARQHLLLFLKRTEETRSGRPVYEVLGWQQGMLAILTEPVSGEQVVRRPVKAPPNHSAKPVLLRLNDFKREVRTLAQPAGEVSPSSEVSP